NLIVFINQVLIFNISFFEQGGGFGETASLISCRCITIEVGCGVRVGESERRRNRKGDDKNGRDKFMHGDMADDWKYTQANYDFSCVIRAYLGRSNFVGISSGALNFGGENFTGSSFAWVVLG